MDRRLAAGSLAVVCACSVLLVAVWRHSVSIRTLESARQDHAAVQRTVRDTAEEIRLYERYWPLYQTRRQQGIIGVRLSTVLAGLDTVATALSLDDWRYSWQDDTPAGGSERLSWTVRMAFVPERPETLSQILDYLEARGGGVLRPRSCLLRQADGSVRAECLVDGASLVITP